MQDLKILIVSAGVAGLTCASLLTRQGIHPHIIEKEKKQDFNTSGYMLGIYPLGGRVINSLDTRNIYHGNSIQMEYYEVYHPSGELIQSYPLDFINDKYGSYRGITRTKLINILLHQIDRQTIKYATTLTDINQSMGGPTVTFSDGTSKKFDLVIIADGLHSQTRNQILREDEYTYSHTGWGGWVSWLQEDSMCSYKEYWGAGSFLGIYPVKDKIGIFLGGPLEIIKEKGLEFFANGIKQKISSKYELPRKALNAFQETSNPFFWDFQDCKADSWHKGHVVLLGDAATGFLPTAGVGASMAMDSAAALADELSRVDRQHITYGLKLYNQRQKKRVEAAQNDSRKLAKIMFIKSSVLSKIRNKMLPFYGLQQILSDLSKVMEGGGKLE